MFREIFRFIYEIGEHNPLTTILTVFIISLISNSIPFASLPYLVVVIIIASRIRDPVMFVGIILFSALGASLGKIVIYSIGRIIYRKSSEKTRENIDYLSKKIRGVSFLAVFIAASTPIPDDVINLPVSFIGYDMIKYITAIFLGKIIVTLTSVVVGGAVISSLVMIGLDIIYSTMIFLTISIYVTYLIARIDWRKVSKAYERKGLKGFLKILYREIVINTIPISRVREREVAETEEMKT